MSLLPEKFYLDDFFDDFVPMPKMPKNELKCDIYNFMFTKGWYTITPEEDTKIEKSYTKYSNKMNELS